RDRDVTAMAKLALRELGGRGQSLEAGIGRLGAELGPLVVATAPGLLGVYGCGVYTAALLLVAAGDNPERLRSEAAWAHLCGVAPIPASSGKVTRYRLNRGGDRQANHALYRIVIVRMRHDPAPAPTSSGDWPRAAPRARSFAVSSATSPARSTASSPACWLAEYLSRGP